MRRVTERGERSRGGEGGSDSPEQKTAVGHFSSDVAACGPRRVIRRDDHCTCPSPPFLLSPGSEVNGDGNEEKERQRRKKEEVEEGARTTTGRRRRRRRRRRRHPGSHRV